MPSPGTAPTLPILRCTKCGAPLVLDGSEHATCASCSTRNDVPARYRDMVLARRVDAAAHAEGEQLVRTLTAPPRRATKILARMFDLHMLGFLILDGIPVALTALFLGATVDRVLVAHHVYPNVDAVPDALYVAMSATFLFVLTLVPRLLGIYANRRAADRAALVGALAARLPSTAGGPAACRACGAPLAVGADQALARCGYCGTDNAVDVDRGLAKHAKTQALGFGATVHDAAAVDAEQRTATRALLHRELYRYGFRVGFLTIGTMLATITNNGDPTLLGGIAGFVSICAGVVFLIRSMNAQERDDAEHRRDYNDASGVWVLVGPIVWWTVCVLAFRRAA